MELYFVVERADRLRVLRFDDWILSVEDCVDALERSHALLDAIASARKLLERIDDRVEDDKIVDKFGRSDATIAREDEIATIPEENGNDGSAEKFADRVGKEIASVYAIERVADRLVERVETVV